MYKKSVMHVQSPYFADEAFCLFDVRVAVALAVSLVPNNDVICEKIRVIAAHMLN